MNVEQSLVEAIGYDRIFTGIEMTFKRCFGASETLMVTDTYQFDDYSKYETSGLNEARKAQRKVEVFPKDCRKAFEIGVRFAGPCRN
jgi:hypothetical protein